MVDKGVPMDKKNIAYVGKNGYICSGLETNVLSITTHSDAPAIRFDYERDGRLTVAVQGGKVEYQGVFDEEQVVSAVRRLGLGQKDRASLYLDAADHCQDDTVAERLMALALQHAEWASRIDGVRQQYDIPLAPIGDVNKYVNSPYADWNNKGLPLVPLTTVETFVPRLSMAVTKEMREQMVHALEGYFVPYHRGEQALRALGLLTGEMTNYVNWLPGLLQLAAVTLFVLGRATLVLEHEEVVNGCCLPAGSYGNGTPIVAARGGGERHWQVVTALFRDSMGRMLNSASLRTMATRVERTDGSEFKEILYLFRPLIFDTYDRPRPNDLFVGGSSSVGTEGAGGSGVSFYGG